MLWCGKINRDLAMKTQKTFQCFAGCNEPCFTSYPTACKSPVEQRESDQSASLPYGQQQLVSQDIEIKAKTEPKSKSATKDRQWLTVLASIMCCKCHYQNLIKDWLNHDKRQDLFKVFHITHCEKRGCQLCVLYWQHQIQQGGIIHGLFHKKQTATHHSAQFASAGSSSTMLHNLRTLRVGARLFSLPHTKLQGRSHIHKQVKCPVLSAVHSSNTFRQIGIQVNSHSVIHSFIHSCWTDSWISSYRCR